MASPFGFDSDLQTFLLSLLTSLALRCPFDTLPQSFDVFAMNSLVFNDPSLDFDSCTIFYLLVQLLQIFYCSDLNRFKTLMTLADSSLLQSQCVYFRELDALNSQNSDYHDLLHLYH